eukprot:GHVS01037306.1.p1 GENE.GHVS01037306.1~~GHVS01037306.1.p1  ORF type:complete len:736 (-),score=198.31 GHVS01037306.1:450-2657(-)
MMMMASPRRRQHFLFSIFCFGLLSLCCSKSPSSCSSPSCSFPSVLLAASSSSLDEEAIIIDDAAEDSDDLASMAPAATSAGASAAAGGPGGAGGPAGGFPSSSDSSGGGGAHQSLPPSRGGGHPSPPMPSEEELRAKARKRVTVPLFGAPKVRESFHYLETFQTTTTTTKEAEEEGEQEGGAVGTWMKSAHPKFTGPWHLARRVVEGIEGDLGLRVGSSAEFHGIAGRMPNRVNRLEEEMRRLEKEKEEEGGGGGKTEREVVVQYEAKFENDLQCGGAYMKLFDLNSSPLEQFNAETDYVLMFGPDRCGETDKVHCIIKIKNPHTGKTTEHQLNSPPKVPHDNLTHLYTLRLKSDDSVEIWIDNKLAKSGHLSTDMIPPMLPLKEIDDPHDSKPADWDVSDQIADPTAVKPEEWDEAQPRTIPDPDAQLPEGWLADEPLEIPDPNATQPEDWDEETSGAWERPVIPNPTCAAAAASAVGCGPWEAPQVPNPAYKGPWQPPMIANPDFMGSWKPRTIVNPDYFEQPLFAMGPVDSVGFELWTMQSGLLFDNILVGSNFGDAQDFAKETWELRNTVESEMNRVMREIASEALAEAEDKQIDEPNLPWHQRTMRQAKRLIRQHGAAFLGTFISVILVILGLVIRRSQKSSALAAAKTPKVNKESVEEEEDGEVEQEEEEEEGKKNDKKENDKKGSEESSSSTRRTTRSRAREEESKGEEEEEEETKDANVRKRKPQKS